MKKYAVILAGGSGRRAGGEMPKQFQLLLGIPLLWWSVRAFHDEDPTTDISVVLHPGFFGWWDLMRKTLPEADQQIPVRLVCGGADRPHSVANGIMQLPDDQNALIAVHDGARPVLTPALVAEGWKAAEKYKAVFPACPVTDSLREKCAEEEMTQPVDRSRFLAVQTPQVFRADILKHAHTSVANPGSFTDDASLVEASGVKTYTFSGDPANIKVTNPIDFKIAAALLGR